MVPSTLIPHETLNPRGPRKHITDGSILHMIDSLRASFCNYGEYLDLTHPQEGMPSPRYGTGFVRPSTRDEFHGIPGSDRFLFAPERDFLFWNLVNNITVCDLGCGTTSYFYKGVRYHRTSEDCHFISKNICNCSQPFVPLSAM